MLVRCAGTELSLLLGIDFSEKFFKSVTEIVYSENCCSSERFCLKSSGEHTEISVAGLDMCVTSSAIFPKMLNKSLKKMYIELN